ncbi:MAG TPA: large-conductance mechanosensitive channel protein MscL [Longimicrobiaceae bacterium]|nr:large-conductance mechanosensitive channel protein MscL [Longimicrobiaceae bacterium]
MWKEFREFIARGNVFDLAVGIVIGAAFTRIVDSFVKDILMPPVGLLTGGVDFSSLHVSLSGQEYESLAKAQEAGAPTLNYGIFINNVLQFLIVAFAVFLLVRSYNRMRRRTESVPAAPTDRECPYCRFTIPIRATRCAHCTSELDPV